MTEGIIAPHRRNPLSQRYALTAPLASKRSLFPPQRGGRRGEVTPPYDPNTVALFRSPKFFVRCGGVYNDGKFTLNSGTIGDNRVNGERTRNHSHGAGVENVGTFVMNGGIIENNSTEGNGVDAKDKPWDVWYVDGGENYTSTDVKEISVTIAPMVVNIDEVTVEDKEYDGTDTATVKDVAFTQPTTPAVYSRRAVAPALNVTSDDYIVTSAKFGSVGGSSANAGTLGANGTIQLLNRNFTFGSNTVISTFTTTSGTITKAVVTNATPLVRYLNAGTEYSYPINDLVSGLTGRQDFGNIDWDDAAFDYKANMRPSGGDDTYQVDEDDNLVVKFLSRENIGDGTFIGTLTLTGEADNLITEGESKLILTVEVYLTQKPVTVSDHTLEKNAITYGQPLSESLFRADTSYLVTNDSSHSRIDGSFSWINPTRVPEAGTRWAEWEFTPDSEHYSTVFSAAQVTVNKATPAIYSLENDVITNGSRFARTYNGSPITFTAKHNVYTVVSDTTTGDYVLTDVPGRWLWSKDGTSVAAPVDAQSNETYTVTFMPNDTVNYNQVTFDVTVTINPKTITPTITAVDREYERGNTSVTLSGGTLADIERRDDGKVSIDLRNATGTVGSDGNGSPRVNITGVALVGAAAGNYKLSDNITTTVTITPKHLSPDMVTLDYSTRRVYDGNAKTIIFTVKDGDTVLTADTDYGVTAGSNSATNAGNHTLKLIGRGNYGGTIDVSWYIEPKPITDDMVEIGDLTYNGSAQRPTITIKDGDTVLENVSYTILGDEEATDAGTYRLSLVTQTAARSARADGSSNYSIRLSAQWSIAPAELTATATVADKRYDGTTAATVTGVTLQNADGTAITVPYSATANFASAEAGTGKTAYVYVTLLDPNYSFAGELATTAVRCTADITGRSGGHGTSGSSSSGTGVTSAATGDAGIALYALLSLSAYTGSALVIRGRKKF